MPAILSTHLRATRAICSTALQRDAIFTILYVLNMCKVTENRRQATMPLP